MSTWQTASYEDNPFAEAPGNKIDSKTALIRPSEDTSVQPPWLQDQSTVQSIPVVNVEKALDTEIPRMILYTRISNLVLSVLMIVVSLLSLLTTNNATTGVLACYVVVFSCLLCCFETHLKQISKFIAMNFGFMYSAKSRTAFMIFVGTILFSFNLFGKIIGLLMLANAGFNIYILFRHPSFDDAQRKDAQSEIKDFLATNPAFAQQILSLSVQTTASVAANNPEVAKQVLHSYMAAPTNPDQQPPGVPQYVDV